MITKKRGIFPAFIHKGKRKMTEEVTVKNVLLKNSQGEYLIPYTGQTGGSSSGGLPPSICKSLRINIDGTSVSLKWQDPQNTILDKQYLCTWAGTKIVKKLGSYPENENDGTLVVDNTVMGQYSENAYVDTITAGEDWKYCAFPYSTNDVYCYNKSNRFMEAIIYEFTVNPNDSNPATRVQYPVGCTNENYDFAHMDFSTGAWSWGDWSKDNFFVPRPCMLKIVNGVTSFQYYLYEHNYAYRADGVTLSDITNVSENWQAMLEWGQVWIKFTLDGTLWHIYVSNVQVDEDYKCYTHRNANGTLVDNIYTMIYQPSNVNSTLRSISGRGIMTNTSGVTMQSYAQANGAGWDFMSYGQWIMIEVLTTLITKSTNVEARIGCGRYSSANNTTGECNTDGYFFGTNGNGRIKMWGAENLIANYWKPVNGCNYSTSTGLMYKLSEDTSDGTTVVGYNASSNGYKSAGLISGSSGGYISQMTLNADGIFPKVVSGSATTYFCDGCWFANGAFGRVGGCYGGSLGGAFALGVGGALSAAGAGDGASLSYVPR